MNSKIKPATSIEKARLGIKCIIYIEGLRCPSV